jgi:OOP family OmpA-OmpF porin
VPGVRSEDRAKNGCPSDRDGDGILDADDACPDLPGVESEDPDKHGCPSDRDGDGVIDAEDACPDVPGVRSQDRAKNGCPGDRDGDGIVDPDDACPDVAGPANQDRSKHGCPAARVEQGQIKILDRIEFKTASHVILEESFPIIEAVRAVLAEHSEITRVSIEGHTDDVGKAAYNKQLSQRRAESVVTWLVKNGIQRKRLEAHGFGMERPLVDNDSDENRQRNRRVEFHIRTVNGQPVGEAGAASLEEK